MNRVGQRKQDQTHHGPQRKRYMREGRGIHTEKWGLKGVGV